jgi:hypothetical protein
MVTQKIVLKTDTFEIQRQKINFIGLDVYQVLTGAVVLESVNIDDVSTIDTSLVVDTSGVQFVANSFAASDFRTTKYLVQVQETGSSNFYSTEVFIIHDGSEVYMTQYGTLNTDSSPVTSIEADINSGNVRLLITPSVSNTTTKISRNSLTA